MRYESATTIKWSLTTGESSCWGNIGVEVGADRRHHRGSCRARRARGALGRDARGVPAIPRALRRRCARAGRPVFGGLARVTDAAATSAAKRALLEQALQRRREAVTI